MKWTLVSHGTVPVHTPDLSRAESAAKAIGALLPGCVRVDLWRPLERLGCEVWL